jgi:tetratricopeptide (TPR) repeat protein
MMNRRLLVLALLPVALAVALWSRHHRAAPPVALPPLVDAPVAAVLADRDVEAATEMAAARGHWAAIRIYDALVDTLASAEVRSVPGRHEMHLDELSLWAEAIAGGYHLPEYRRDAAFWRQAPSPVIETVIARRRAARRDLAPGALPADSARARLLDHAAALREAGDRMGCVRADYDVANLCLKLGLIAEARERCAAVLDDARRWNLTAETCDALNSLALFALLEGDPAGADNLKQALALARRSRLAARAGRALTIAGMEARREGRFAVTLDLLEDAVAECGRLGGAWEGLPYLVYLMRFHAGLGDWRQVADLMPRAEALLNEARAVGADPLMVGRESVRLGELQLRLAIHEGRVDEALANYPELLADAGRQPFAEVAYINDRQVRALLETGRPDAALTVLPAALAQARRQGQPELPALLLAGAEADLHLGRLDSMRARLEEVSAHDPARAGRLGDLALDACGLWAQMLHREGHTAAASDSLRRGLALLLEDVADSDASSLAYLELQRNRVLRQALLDIAGDDLRTDYGLRLLWRRLPASFGGAAAAPELVGDPAAAGRRAADRRQAALGPGQIHLFYDTADDRVLRWRTDATSVRRDTLAAGAAELAADIDGLLALLGRDPGDLDAPIPPELARRAERLAAVLLPPDLLGGASPARLMVSADGALASLPFAVLDLDPGAAYHPLALDVELVQLRDAGPRPPAREEAGAPVMVIDPRLDAELLRRYPGLATLAAADAEADRVRALAPDVIELAGAEATVANLRQVWQQAPLLYFGCHTVRSPESPFRTFLPLGVAVAGGSDPEDAYLDIGGIRAAGFAGCRLVVLASCASGAPYVSGQAHAPSLGDAFLDAGAEAALQTLWRVRDDMAAGIPLAVLDRCRRDGLDPVAALAAVRREAMAAPGGGVRHPFGWAAYVLELREP